METEVVSRMIPVSRVDWIRTSDLYFANRVEYARESSK